MSTILSPKLTQNIPKVKDPILRNRFLNLHRAPTSIKETLFSDKTREIIQEIISKHKLSDNQWGETSLAVAKVLLSELHPRDLERYLEDTLEVDEFVAVEIAKEIKNKILAPIKEDLMKLYPGLAAPSASTPTRPVQTPFSPARHPQAPHNLPIKPNQSIVTTEKNVVKVEK